MPSKLRRVTKVRKRERKIWVKELE